MSKMPTYVHSLWNDYDANPHLTTKCKNFDIWCKSKVDDFHGGTRAGNKGLCINCDIIFGKPLEHVEYIECPVCLESGPGIKHIKCDHTSCNSCFLKMNIGMWDLDTRPIEPPCEFDEDENPILPNPEYEQWCEEDYQWEQNGYSKDNLRKCPLCRQ